MGFEDVRLQVLQHQGVVATGARSIPSSARDGSQLGDARSALPNACERRVRQMWWQCIPILEDLYPSHLTAFEAITIDCEA